MSDTELLNCPFCKPIYEPRIHRRSDKACSVLCINIECGAESGLFETEAQAVRAWNSRAEVTTLTAKLKAAEEALENQDVKIKVLQSQLYHARKVLCLARDAVESFMECPYNLEESTVPSAGISANPSQVVLNISCGYERYEELKRDQLTIETILKELPKNWSNHESKAD